jgi:hypothetical protein
MSGNTIILLIRHRHRLVDPVDGMFRNLSNQQRYYNLMSHNTKISWARLQDVLMTITNKIHKRW